MSVDEAEVLAGRFKSVSARYYVLHDPEKLTDKYDIAWSNFGFNIRDLIVQVKITIENFSSLTTMLGGGFFIGILVGYVLKKVIKIAAVILGLFLTAFQPSLLLSFISVHLCLKTLCYNKKKLYLSFYTS